MRTEIGMATQVNAKWNISFNTFLGKPGVEHLSSVITTPSIFNSEDEAYAAGVRALFVLEQTGRFPNFETL